MKLPLGNGKKAIILIVAFVGSLLFTLSKCSAKEVDFGAGAAVVHTSGPVVSLRYKWELGLDVKDDPQAFCGTVMTSATREVANNWAWYCGLEARRGFFHMGIGAAYLQRADSVNGSNTNYTLSMGYSRWKWCPIEYRHFSNAGTSPINRGRDMLMCEWRLR